MVKRVQNAIQKQAGFQPQINNPITVSYSPKEEDLHKKEIQDRLFKVVSISSAVDVLNGLRKWYSVTSQVDVFVSQL